MMSDGLMWEIIILQSFLDNITGPIGEMITDMFGGNDLLIGVFLLVMFTILTFLFGLGMLVGSVVIIPTMFAVFRYIPSLRIVLAIFLGLVFGLALNKFIKR